MRLAQKLILFALAVALIPLAATGFSVIRIGEDALRRRIAEHQGAAALAVAAKVSQAVEELARRLATAMEVFDVTALSAEERAGFAHMLYRQSDDISMVLLLNAAGELLAAPAAIAAPEVQGELSRHPGAGAAEVGRLISHLARPTAPVRQGAVLLSPVYYPESTDARVAIAVPGGLEDGVAGVVAGVEVAIRKDTLQLEGVETGVSSQVFVVDASGRAIVHPSLAVGTDLRTHAAVAAFLSGENRGTSLAGVAGGAPQVAAFAPVGALGWAVVVEQPEAVAFAAALSMRRQVLGWIVLTIVGVLAGGLWFAARLRRVLTKMVDGAHAFGEGRLKRRIEVDQADEIGELAKTMNGMAARLEKSLGEIEEWNRTLEAKVEQRTRELEATQAQLLVQSKLAALGQLGAGVAHEVNNPLAGILGMAQLLMRDHQAGDKDFGKLKEIEAAAKRCKEITMRLLRFSERRLVGRVEVALNDIVDEVAEMLSPGLVAGGVTLLRELAADIPKITADPGQLAQVFINLINNSKTAMPKGGTVTLKTRALADGVQAVVADTGAGIKKEHLPRIFDPFFTTKRVWSDVGLGLSVSYRIVTDHGGRIDVDSEEGKGSAFVVTLPFKPPPGPVASPSELIGKKSVLLE
ncbi:MAG: HAMP domain-containing protein [Deltaproteobacteria bacterium]|nr:HAMP domain-containing protein [Deltaproteobacteria bacterium]